MSVVLSWPAGMGQPSMTDGQADSRGRVALGGLVAHRPRTGLPERNTERAKLLVMQRLHATTP